MNEKPPLLLLYQRGATRDTFGCHRKRASFLDRMPSTLEHWEDILLEASNGPIPTVSTPTRGRSGRGRLEGLKNSAKRSAHRIALLDEEDPIVAQDRQRIEKASRQQVIDGVSEAWQEVADVERADREKVEEDLGRVRSSHFSAVAEIERLQRQV